MVETKTKTLKVEIEVTVKYTSDKALDTAIIHINNTDVPYLAYSSVINHYFTVEDFKDAYSIIQEKGFKIIQEPSEGA